MQLHLYTDASFMSETSARSRAGATMYLGCNWHDKNQPINGSIDNISTIISTVVGSASEAEYAGQYLGAGRAEPLRMALFDLGYPQGPTKLISDNETAVGIANETVKQKRSRSMYMQYHWIQDRIRLGHFNVIYEEGKNNKADILTKIIHPKSYRDRRPWYSSENEKSLSLWSTPCAETKPQCYAVTRPPRLLDT
jgi:hypothetical protein